MHEDSNRTSNPAGLAGANGLAVLVDGVRFRYPGGGAFELAVSRLELAPGSSLAITGPSGCGKTTLANLVTGVAIPLAGRVEVGGRDLGSLSDAARRAYRIAHVGVLFQDFGLLEYLTALDNVLLPYLLEPGLGGREGARDRAQSLADDLGLSERLGNKPGALSTGERQRVALARALVTEPMLVVADEPTGNLDPPNAKRATELLLKSVTGRGAALLTITHDPAVAAMHSTTMDLGSLVPSSN